MSFANNFSAAENNPFFDSLQRCRKGLLTVLIFSFCINMLMLSVPVYMLQIYDRVLTSRSYDTLFFLTLIAIFAFLILAGLEVNRGIITSRIGNWLDQRLSGNILTTEIEKSLEREKSPSIQGLRDIATIRQFLTGNALFSILDAPWTPIFIGVIFMLHQELGWIALVGACLLLFIAFLSEVLTRKVQNRASNLNMEALSQAEAAVRNSNAIEAMGMMPGLVNRWSRLNAEVIQNHCRATQRSGVLRAVVRFVRLGLQIAILGFGAFLVLEGELTSGAMIAAVILAGRALSPVDQAIASWRTAVAARSAYNRIRNMFVDTPLRRKGMPLPRPQGELSVEDVGYGPPHSTSLIIQGIKLKLPAGQSLGLIGPTAAGKSTLAQLFVGTIKPSLGHVRLDGMDIAEWGADDRGLYIGYLPQEVELFNATIRQNIARMQEDSDPEQTVAAAKLAHVHDMIMRLPQGYDTVIGDGGVRLSGGQRQRVALARAVYGEPRLVVLDEPAANLDQEGETALLDTLKCLKEKGITTVTIAHRPNTLRFVDQILVLKGGSIELYGPRDAILAELSKFRLVAPVREASG